MTSCNARSPLSCLVLHDGRAFLVLCRQLDLCDFAKAIGFGVMRPRDKRSAHFCAVPARYDAEPERLFGFDVTRRKILHGVCFQVGTRFHSGAGGFWLFCEQQFVQPSSESRAKSASTTATRSR
jgi:hypothetical protein